MSKHIFYRFVNLNDSVGIRATENYAFFLSSPSFLPQKNPLKKQRAFYMLLNLSVYVSSIVILVFSQVKESRSVPIACTHEITECVCWALFIFLESVSHTDLHRAVHMSEWEEETDGAESPMGQVFQALKGSGRAVSAVLWCFPHSKRIVR